MQVTAGHLHRQQAKQQWLHVRCLDIAVLLRSARQSAAVNEQLSRSGITTRKSPGNCKQCTCSGTASAMNHQCQKVYNGPVLTCNMLYLSNPVQLHLTYCTVAPHGHVRLGQSVVSALTPALAAAASKTRHNIRHHALGPPACHNPQVVCYHHGGLKPCSARCCLNRSYTALMRCRCAASPAVPGVGRQLLPRLCGAVTMNASGSACSTRTQVQSAPSTVISLDARTNKQALARQGALLGPRTWHVMPPVLHLPCKLALL